MTTLLSTHPTHFPPSPTLSSSYPDLLSIKNGGIYPSEVDDKSAFVHAEYDNAVPASLASTAPSSPLYTQSMSSADSYFSTPSYSSLDPDEVFEYDDDDDSFPLFDNNFASTPVNEVECSSSQSLTPIETPRPGRSAKPAAKLMQGQARDELDIEHEPSRHVDYLSHEWDQEDIWSSWRYVVARRKKITNSERLENAAWRTWIKTKYDLKTISPESLNWMKDCDVTWLYGPLHVESRCGMMRDSSPPQSRLSTSSSFLHKKPILKKRSPSAILLEKSQIAHTLLQRASDIIQVQRSSPVPRPGLRRGGSDFSLPSYHTSSVLNTPAERSDGSDLTTRCSFGGQTPCEAKHVFFNEEVRQVQAIDSEDDEKEHYLEQDSYETDEDDDGGLMMAPAPRDRSNRSTPRGSFSDANKTIAPLPPTTLKSRSETPQPIDMAMNIPPRSLQHSSSQETLKPTQPKTNFLIDDDPEIDGPSWAADHGVSYSPYSSEFQDQPEGMRRTASGMFMPCDEDEEAIMNNTLFGQAVYAVNTFRDIAHVIWNVGWRQNR